VKGGVMLKAAIIFFVLGILSFTFSVGNESNPVSANKGRVLISLFLLFSMISLIAGLFISSTSL